MQTIKDQQQKMAEMQTILDQHEAELANLAHSVPQRTPPATPSGQERDKTVLLGANVSNYYLHIPKTGGVGAFSQLRSNNGGRKVCNHARRDVSHWKSWGHWWLHASESGPTTFAKKQFVVLRKPRDHVLSQYFHCTEARGHRDRAHFMPSLDVWLEWWVDRMKRDTFLEEKTKKTLCLHPNK